MEWDGPIACIQLIFREVRCNTKRSVVRHTGQNRRLSLTLNFSKYPNRPFIPNKHVELPEVSLGLRMRQAVLNPNYIR